MLFLLIALLPCSAPEIAEPAAQPPVRAQLRAMLRNSRYGFGAEQAAFLVRLPGGGFAFVMWPESGQLDSAQWAGPVPSGTIAIVHTHPAWLPHPSRRDRHTSRNCRLPVYVVTRSAIAKSTCGVTEIIVRGDW